MKVPRACIVKWSWNSSKHGVFGGQPLENSFLQPAFTIQDVKKGAVHLQDVKLYQLGVPTSE